MENFILTVQYKADSITPVQNNFTSAGKHHCCAPLSCSSSGLRAWSPPAKKKEDVLVGVGLWSFLSSCGSPYAKTTWWYLVNSPSLWGGNHTEQLAGTHCDGAAFASGQWHIPTWSPCQDGGWMTVPQLLPLCWQPLRQKIFFLPSLQQAPFSANPRSQPRIRKQHYSIT